MKMINRYQNATIFNRISILKSYFSHTPNATEHVNRLVNPYVDLQIISKEKVKPASPTPSHLRTFNLSITDQYMINIYTPSLLFLPNADKSCVSNIGNIRSRRLKESLSELLTLYYPFAGEIKDNLHIECNDKGVYFVEARVFQTLEEFFFFEPNDQKMRELNPISSTMTECSSMNYVASVQVNIFSCGGIGLFTSFSHKIVDGQSYYTLMKAWAAASSRGLSEAISPSFVASEVFPYNPSLKNWFPWNLSPKNVVATKRFVFDSIALASLKSQLVSCNDKHMSRSPTRVEATTSLVWKAVAKAVSKVKPFSPHSPHTLLSIVDLRKKVSPPFPNESIGNLIVKAIGVCFPNKQLHLSSLMGEMRESIAKISSENDIETLKGGKGQKALEEKLRAINDMLNVMEEGDCLLAISMLNGGIYEVDFGWGKPIWFYHMNPGSAGVVSLNDVLKGGGVEAVVSLSCEEMKIFERDPENLSYTTLNPSPLNFLE